MPIVAYYGNPGRLFGRVEFHSWDAARIAAWNDGALFDLHDTDERTTCWDRVWDSYEESPRQHEQLALPLGFEAESRDTAIGTEPAGEGWDIEPETLDAAIAQP